MMYYWQFTWPSLKCPVFVHVTLYKVKKECYPWRSCLVDAKRALFMVEQVFLLVRRFGQCIMLMHSAWCWERWGQRRIFMLNFFCLAINMNFISHPLQTFGWGAERVLPKILSPIPHPSAPLQENGHIRTEAPWGRSLNTTPRAAPLNPTSKEWKVKVKVKSLSHVWLFGIPWTVVYQASLSMGFSKQEYWSGLPFPSPGDLPDPGIEPRFPALQADTLPSEPPGNITPGNQGSEALFKSLPPSWERFY